MTQQVDRQRGVIVVRNGQRETIGIVPVTSVRVRENKGWKRIQLSGTSISQMTIRAEATEAVDRNE